MIGMLTLPTSSHRWNSLVMAKIDPAIFSPFVSEQTDFTELSITKHHVGNLETIFTEQE